VAIRFREEKYCDCERTGDVDAPFGAGRNPNIISRDISIPLLSAAIKLKAVRA
jgi:hypothetical protein